MQLYGLADCNNFYCSCERVFHPDLVGKPVVVLSNNDGCVIARSEEAKRLGISMGAAFYQVKEQLEQAKVAVFSSNYNLYGDMSRRVHTMLGRYTPNVDIYSIDEAFIDLSDLGDSEYITNYGKRIVREVTKGTGIPISLGVAPTKTLAKMCSKFAKHYPGYEGCCLIDSEEKREKALKLFPIEDVWGIGRRSVDKLKYHGVKTAWDLTQKTESWVQRMLTITGVRTWRELRGESCICIDERAVVFQMEDRLTVLMWKRHLQISQHDAVRKCEEKTRFVKPFQYLLTPIDFDQIYPPITFIKHIIHLCPLRI